MDIQQLLLPPVEEVDDSPDDFAEQIAQRYEPTPTEESDDDEVEVLPRIAASQALVLLSQLRLHEEQSSNCNTDWIQSLDRYEKVVRTRQFEGLQQRPLDSYFFSN